MIKTLLIWLIASRLFILFVMLTDCYSYSRKEILAYAAMLEVLVVAKIILGEEEYSEFIAMLSYKLR